MSVDMKTGTIRRKAPEDLARPLPLETVSGGTAATGAQEIIALPHHGLISRERLGHLYAQDLAALAEEARRGGYEEGLSQALAESVESDARESEVRRLAREEADAQLTEKLVQLDGVITALGAQRDALLQEAEGTVIELMYACLTRLLGTMAVDGELIQGLVSKALEGQSGNTSLNVRLSLNDHAALAECGGLERMPEGVQVRFIADPKLHLSQCLIESPRGTLDAGLEQQLAELKAALSAVYHHGNATHAQPAE